jgi:hypothetical protein
VFGLRLGRGYREGSIRLGRIPWIGADLDPDFWIQGLAPSREESVRVTLLPGITWTWGGSDLFSCEAVFLQGMGESWRAAESNGWMRLGTMNRLCTNTI